MRPLEPSVGLCGRATPYRAPGVDAYKHSPGCVPHPSRFVPPSLASQDFWSRAAPCDDAELIAAIESYLRNYNQEPTPFIWTATVEEILRKVGKCKAILVTHH